MARCMLRGWLRVFCFLDAFSSRNGVSVPGAVVVPRKVFSGAFSVPSTSGVFRSRNRGRTFPERPSCLECCVRLLGLVFLPRQFAVGVLHAFLMCRPYLGCCVRLAGLVLLLSPVFACLSSCLPAWLGCCVRPLGLSPSPACLRSCLPSGLPACLGCRVRALGLSPKFHVRFEQLFGVFGGYMTNFPNPYSHLMLDLTSP